MSGRRPASPRAADEDPVMVPGQLDIWQCIAEVERSLAEVECSEEVPPDAGV